MFGELRHPTLPEVDTSRWSIEGYMTTAVKSTQMHMVENPVFTEGGIFGDRWYAVFDGITNKMITGRDIAKGGNNLVRIRSYIDSGGNLELIADGKQLTVRPSEALGQNRYAIWDTEFEGSYFGGDVSSWIKEVTGIDSAVLVYVANARTASSRFLKEAIGISGQDAYPYHVINLTTLEYLNAKLIKKGLLPLGVMQTRANIIIKTPQPFEELFAEAFDVPGGKIEMPKPCVRCTFTGVQSETGEYTGSNHLKEIVALYKEDPELRKYLQYWKNLGVAGPILGQNGIFKPHSSQ